MFVKGDKITVVSTDHRNGFVRHDGTFLRNKTTPDGAVYGIEYDWCGMTASVFSDRVTVARREKSFRFH